MADNPIDLLLQQWSKDSVVDTTEPGKELLRIPQLHARYLQILSRHSLLSKHCERELVKLKRCCYDYYSGRLDKEQLSEQGLPPFKFILKTEIKDYVDSDNRVQTLLAKKAIHDELVRVCESVMKELNSRTYQLRSYIDYLKWSSGG